ncbi:hypothetical protein TNIN_414591 [Trichonephila inaurata madagascariensis]|uniref:Uncharacterized protein n=1 Tax=Trichonephila inaurata madagascariensis TaxID=2747483 RepID=A0A8X6XVD8_9ARAC|nr:hypothetical protein TNIN_414591 [Trichonephila inaurata madagascariensis]
MCFTCPYKPENFPFLNFVFYHIAAINVILGWDFLGASQAVLDCGKNNLFKDICRDSTAPDAWENWGEKPPGGYTLKGPIL